MTKEELLQSFSKIYGEGKTPVCVFSPGRVNLIGEHTDYNGGHVFPCALTIGTYFAARKRSDKLLRFYSGNFEMAGIVERSLDQPDFEKSKGFTNYLMGMVVTYAKHGFETPCGLDVYLWGNIPNASGLSSSASVEVGMGKILCGMFGFEVSNQDNAIYARECENQYMGLNCGIMDQFAIAMGKKDQAIFLDTATLKFEYAPVVLQGMKIVISCTNKKRGLLDSKYNERFAECMEALKEMQTVVKIDSLGDLTNEQFEQYKEAIKSEVRMRRARHAVYENRRTIDAVALLKAGDIAGFGQLMNASHDSLRDDYEVTGKELDTIVDEARKVPGVLGARMTGAGFGGCAVAIVKDESVDRFITEVGKNYEKKIGYAADFYVVEIGDGTDLLK